MVLTSGRNMGENYREKTELFQFIFQIHVEAGNLVNDTDYAQPQYIKRRVVAGKMSHTLLKVAYPMSPKSQVRGKADSVQHHKVEQDNQ